MNVKLKNLIVRALSGVLLAIVVLGAIYLSYWGFGALLLAITIGSVRELYRMARLRGVEPHAFAGYCCAAGVVAFGFDYFYNGSQYNIHLSLFMMLVASLIFVVELFGGDGERPLENLGVTMLAPIYVATPLAMLAGVPLMLSGGEWNPFVMILYILIIWCNDSFAYLVGVSIGRHKLYERISPKKSWEGLIGGVVCAVLMSIVAAKLTCGDTMMWIGVGVITSIVGCLGDFVESMFKRSCGVKDSGRILPGHGGWLDRFDSLIFSAPFVFVFLIIYSHL